MKQILICLLIASSAPAAGSENHDSVRAAVQANRILPLSEIIPVIEARLKPDTPSCTTCHTANPTAGGEARTGKPIEPLAPGANPKRFTDTAFVEKWFGRNCNSVLGLDCSAKEKADIISWLMSL